MFLSSSTPADSLVDQLVVPRGQSVLCIHLSRLELINPFPDCQANAEDPGSSTSRILAVSVLNKWFFRVELEEAVKDASSGNTAFDLYATAFYRIFPDEGMKEKFEAGKLTCSNQHTSFYFSSFTVQLTYAYLSITFNVFMIYQNSPQNAILGHFSTVFQKKK
jgi:hypothetical protein